MLLQIKERSLLSWEVWIFVRADMIHMLFVELDTTFLEYFHNPTIPIETIGMWQPRLDLHCKIEGPATYDVLKNFEQQWYMETKLWAFQCFKRNSHWKEDSESRDIQIFPSMDLSYHSSEKQSTSSVDLKKKRKLQYESGSLDMPSPKQQCRGGANILGHDLVNNVSLTVEAILRETQDLGEQQKSENGSNSSIYDLMASDAKGKFEPSITQAIHQDQPSTSLNSYSNGVFKSSHYCLDSRGIKEENHVAGAVSEDTLPFDPRLKIAEDLYPDFGLDHSISELGSEGDAETENMILYSNDVAPHSFVLSSGKWNLGQGGPMGAKRPTIDQEFEQYFSSLML